MNSGRGVSMTADFPLRGFTTFGMAVIRMRDEGGVLEANATKEEGIMTLRSREKRFLVHLLLTR